MRKLPFGRTLVAMMITLLVAGWFWSVPAGPRAVLPIRSNHIVFSPDSRWLLKGDRLFRFDMITGQTWDLREKRVVQKLKEAPNVRPMGAGLGYLSDNEVRIVDLKTGETLGACPLPKHHSFTAADATADQTMVIGNMIAGWGPVEPVLFDRVAQSYRTIPNGTFTTALAISPDGAWCAVRATGKHYVNMRKPSAEAAPERVDKNKAISDWIANLLDSVFSNRFGHLPTSMENLFILSTVDFSMRDAIPDGTQARISPDGKTLATISKNGDVSLWDFPIPRPVGKTVAASISVGLVVFGLLTWFKRSTTGPAAAKNAGQ